MKIAAGVVCIFSWTTATKMANGDFQRELKIAFTLRRLRRSAGFTTVRRFPMLTISQVTKSFGGRILFEDASLQVNRGDRVGLVGPNGAGKSTLFSLILGTRLPDTGQGFG